MSRWWRIGAWWIGLGTVGWCCLASAADRLAGQGVLVAAPALLTGGQALTVRAASALERGRVREAAALGRAAVGRRPTDAVALRVAGFAALATGGPTMGDRLLRLAGFAGWRDVPTQHYWATMSIRAGAWEIAAERLDAALRVDPGDRVAAAGLRAIERAPAGDAALARRLVAPNNWSADWLAMLDGLDQAGLEARLVTLRRVWPALGPAARDRIGWALVTVGAAEEAQRLLRPNGRIPSLATASDGGGPFVWSLASAAGLDVAPTRAGLHVQATGDVPVPVASVTVLPPVGDLRLAVATRGARTDLPLLATLDCPGKASIDAEPLAPSAGLAVVWLHVPEGCWAGRLTISVSGGEAAGGADLWLGTVTLSRAP